jgi:hypothetical protein
MTKLSDISLGDKLVAEAGIPCLTAGEVYEVIEVDQGLAVTCRHGPHLIAARWYFDRLADQFYWVRPEVPGWRHPRGEDFEVKGFKQGAVASRRKA